MERDGDGTQDFPMDSEPVAVGDGLLMAVDTDVKLALHQPNAPLILLKCQISKFKIAKYSSGLRTTTA